MEDNYQESISFCVPYKFQDQTDVSSGSFPVDFSVMKQDNLTDEDDVSFFGQNIREAFKLLFGNENA